MAASHPTLPTVHLPRRRRALAASLAVGAVAAGLLALAPATSASAASPASRVPGTPVAPVKQFDQSYMGGTNPKVGTVPSTAAIGTPNAGVVPVVGKVSAVADDGAYVLYESQLSPRIVDLMVQSPALGGAAPVRLQLPPTWKSTPKATYPAIFLLHGGAEKADYQSWSLYSTERAATNSTNALVVMPSTGSAAYATNFWNFGLGSFGGKQYDSFVATELEQILQRGYRANGRNAIAGLSSGGNSALDVAMHHPGEFGAAASFSGVDNTQLPLIEQTIEFGPIIDLAAPAAMWGDPLVNSGIWRDNNPAADCTRFGGMKVWVSAGNGQPGPFDNGQSDPYEPIVQTATQSFVSSCASAGVPIHADLYGNGTHSWPYWSRELGRALPMLEAGVGLSS